MEENIKDKDNLSKGHKAFKLTNLSVENSTTVFVLTILIVVLGIFSYITLPKENFPEVEIPTIYIGTAHPGNSPEDMENLITRPIEKEVNTVENVSKIQSVSVQDYSTIVVEFTTGTNVTEALLDVKDAVDKAKSELPNDLKKEPDVFELNFSEFPIMNINLSGNYSLEDLKDYAEYLEDEIEKFSEISKAEIRGLDDKEVKILADPYQMEARMVSFSDIENAIAAENVTLSSGNILTDGVRRTIRIVGEFEDPEQMEDVIVKNENNNIVYLRDVAKVSFDYVERKSYARLNGEAVVMVDVVKRSGENMLDATDKVFALVERAKAEVFPPDLKVVITNDQSKDTRDQVSSLENNIISGVILVTLVLLFFLGTRNALFVGMAIPLSMFLSFLVLGALGVTINMMVLFALIMGLGMLVDNGIVVVENVYRLIEDGMSPIKATKRGVGEIAFPIISSTATTLAAFLPLAFWPGIMGEFMKYLPITLIITLGSSLFVALIINPVFIAKFMQHEDDMVNDKKRSLKRGLIMIGIGLVMIAIKLLAFEKMAVILVFGNLIALFGILTILNAYVLTPASVRFQSTFLPWLENIYMRTLSYALKGWRPVVFFFGTVLLLVFSFVLMAVFTPNVIFFPINQPKYANVFVEFPVGTDIETVNDFTVDLEKLLAQTLEPYSKLVESTITNVGSGTADPNDPSAIGSAETPNEARITVNFVESKLRGDMLSSDVLNEIREGLGDFPGVTVTVDKDAAGPPTGKPVSIEISGEDYQKLIAITENLKGFINNSGIEGIERLKSDLETGKPEVLVDIDREKARRFGLSSYTIASEIRTALFGLEISKFKQGEDDYKVNLRLQEDYRYNIDALMNKSITYRDQSSGKIRQVPISAVADAKYSSSFGSIKRKDMDRVVTLSSNVLDGHNATAINDQLKLLVQDFQLPAGYDIKFTGEQEKQAEEMAFLSQALMLAVFLIFMIIVSQFNKVSAPFIIMTSVVFSTIGVFLGLVIFQMDFIVIMTMVGIISLAGIVVNNAIVLIDFIELIRADNRRKENLDDRQKLDMQTIHDTIVEAGKTRLRPVLLTAITTVLGLIPLAMGINIDFLRFFKEYDLDFYIGGDNVVFWGPMSWTIIFGLTFATFLTLVIVPVMYLLVERIRRRFSRIKV